MNPGIFDEVSIAWAEEKKIPPMTRRPFPKVVSAVLTSYGLSGEEFSTTFKAVIAEFASRGGKKGAKLSKLRARRRKMGDVSGFKDPRHTPPPYGRGEIAQTLWMMENDPVRLEQVAQEESFLD